MGIIEDERQKKLQGSTNKEIEDIKNKAMALGDVAQEEESESDNSH